MAGSRGGSANDEAAAWLVRLQSRSISTAELEEFARWRRDPEHAAAYERAQALWDESAGLSDDPDIRDALRGEDRGEQKQEHGRGQYISHPVMMVTTVVAAIMALMIAFTVVGRTATPETYRTAVGERSTARLADGSDVQLDTSSEVAARFATDERRVSLERGQAFFRVVHDPDRPFVVDAGDGITITAVGTAFDVRRTTDRVLVALVDGVVIVHRGSEELARMRSGTVVEIAVGNGIVPTRRTVDQAIGWRSGHLSFSGTSLGQAVEEMNRYRTTRLKVARPAAVDEPISGEFSVDDPDGFLRGVNALLGRGTVAKDGPD